MSAETERAEALLREMAAAAGAGEPQRAVALIPDLLAIDDAAFLEGDATIGKQMIDVGGGLLGTREFTPLELLMAKGLRLIGQSRGSRPWELFAGLYNLSGLYQMAGSDESSAQVVATIATMAESLDEPVDRVTTQVLFRLGARYLETGAPASAAVLYRLLHRTVEASPGVSAVAYIGWLQKYGHVLALSGQHGAAIAVYRRALERFTDGGEALDARVALFNMIADASQKSGAPQEAERAFEEACAMLAETGAQDSRMAGALYHNYASWFAAREDVARYDRAEALARRAAEISRRTGGEGTADLAASLALAGQLAMVRGRYDEAEASYEEALHIFDAAGGVPATLVADHVTDWGFVALRSGRPQHAIERFSRALALRQSAGAPDAPNSVSNLATAHFEAGSLAEAIPLYRRAVELRERAVATA